MPSWARRAGLSYIANVVAIDADGALVDIEKSGEQPDDGALAGACLTDQGNTLAWSGAQANLLQNRFTPLCS